MVLRRLQPGRPAGSIHRRRPNRPPVGPGHGQAGGPAALIHHYAVLHASFSPDGRRLATASAEWKGGEVRIWSCDTGELVKAFPQDSAHRVFFSPDGKKGLTSSLRTRLLKRRPLDKPPTVLHHKTVVDRAGFSPDSACVLTTTQDTTARLWETSTGEPLSPPLRHEARIWHTSFSADSRRWRTASHNGIVRTWAIARTGGPTRTLPHDRVCPSAGAEPRRAPCGHFLPRQHRPGLGPGHRAGDARRRHDDLVWGPVFSPDGRWVLSASDDGDSPGCGMRHRQDGHRARCGTGSRQPPGLWTAFSPDGQYLVVAGGSPEGSAVRARPGSGRSRQAGRPARPSCMPRWSFRRSSVPTAVASSRGSNGGAFVWDLEKAAVQVEVGRENLGSYLAALQPRRQPHPDGQRRRQRPRVGGPDGPSRDAAAAARHASSGTWPSAPTVAGCSQPARTNWCGSGTRPRGSR